MITGVGAAINDIHCLERFKIVTSGFDNAVGCSDSAGAVVRTETNKDWKGVAVGYGYAPPKLPGDVFTFSGGGLSGGGWSSAANGAIVDRVTIFANPNDSEIFYYHLFFSGNGSLTAGSFTPQARVSPNPKGSAERGISIGSTAITGISQWTLDIIATLPDPIWPAGCGGWPTRAPAGASRADAMIDAIVKWNQHPGQVSELAAVNDTEIFKLWVTSTLYWELSWMQVSEVPEEFVVRTREGKPEWVVSEGVAKFASYLNGAQGFIKTPAGTSPATFWPPAA